MSEELLCGRRGIEEALAWIRDAQRAYSNELASREGNDPGGILEALDALGKAEQALDGLHLPRLDKEIEAWEQEQDRLADMADAQSY